MGEKDVLVVFKGVVNEYFVVVVVFEFEFMGGFMGLIVGEKFVWVVNVVIENCCFLVCFFVSGGVCM